MVVAKHWILDWIRFIFISVTLRIKEEKRKIARFIEKNFLPDSFNLDFKITIKRETTRNWQLREIVNHGIPNSKKLICSAQAEERTSSRHRAHPMCVSVNRGRRLYDSMWKMSCLAACFLCTHYTCKHPRPLPLRPMLEEKTAQAIKENHHLQKEVSQIGCSRGNTTKRLKKETNCQK